MKVAEGIQKVRKGDILVEPGYDGVFGQVRIWGLEEKEGGVEEKRKADEQMTLF